MQNISAAPIGINYWTAVEIDKDKEDICEMEPGRICFIFGLIIIPVVFLFKRQVLADDKNLGFFYVATILLALTGLVTIFFVEERPNFYIFLCCPLYSLTIHRGLLVWFRHGHHRDPVETNKWAYGKNIFWDKTFSFCFIVLSLCVPIFLMAIFFHKSPLQ